MDICEGNSGTVSFKMGHTEIKKALKTLHFQYFQGLGCINSEQLVGESNPCFRRERAAS